MVGYVACLQRFYYILCSTENGEEGKDKEGSSDKTDVGGGTQGTTIPSRAESLVDPTDALEVRSKQDSEDCEY